MTAVEKFEKKTRLVVLLTAVAMVVEIITGSVTGSMALLADGIHMGSHVLAIGLSWIAYVLVRRLTKNEKFSGSTDKILSLSGFSSGLILLIFAVFILVQAVKRFLDPVEIEFKEAIIVAVAGLIVNIVSAFILHHKQEETDNNIKAAYLHVIADAFTSVTAIIGLTAAMIWKISYVDTIAAVLSSFIIMKWSVALLRDTVKVLIDIK